MQDSVEGRTRYLVHYSDGGLDVGSEVTDRGARYRVERIEQPPHERAFGHAWARLIESG
jgi:hypothetical protein